MRLPTFNDPHMNVGRFYFQVKVDSGQIFEAYYDCFMKSAGKRKGESFLYQDLG